jgi:regulator of protease activity HflC (stomatin/prohibitin superfamily)
MQRQAAFFVFIIAAAAAIFYIGIIGLAVNPILWGTLLLVLAFIALLSPRAVEFKEYERGVFFRFGKFSHVAQPGVHLWFPVIDSYDRVDIRVFSVKVPSQQVITSDNISVDVGVAFLLRVKDAKRAVIEVKDYQTEITEFTSSELRNSASQFTLQEMLDDTNQLDSKMIATITPLASQWGLELVKLAVEDIKLPPEIKDAMDARRQAIERKAKLETDAEASQLVLQRINEVASTLSSATLEYLYLDTMRKMADGKATKIVLPMELSRIAEAISATLAARNLPSSPRE